MRPAFRLLPLPFCIALSLPAHADDPPPDFSLCPIGDAVPAFDDVPVPQGDPEDRATQPTDIAGDELDGVHNENMIVRGNVQLRRGDQFLGTDKLTYDTESGEYLAEGSVRYQDSGMRLVADRARGDQDADSHRLEDVRYQLVSRRGNGRAEAIALHGTTGSLVGSTYSTCDPSDRQWELRAGKIEVDTETGMGTATNATLHIRDVPVLYVPWFVFPVDDRRRTGLLYPSIGTSSRNGFDYGQPIYLNLAPNYDATIEPRFMSKRGAMLGAEFRYLLEQGAGTFEASFLPDDDLAERERDKEIADGVPPENRRKDDRSHFSFNGYQNLDEHWQARASVNWISDPYYVEDFSSSLDNLSPVYLASDIGVHGRGETWSAGIDATYYLLSDYTLTEQFLPHHRLPRTWFRWERPFRPWLVAGMDAEAVQFEHSVRPGGARIDFKPWLSMPIEGDSWFLKPTFAWRHTAYELEHEFQPVVDDLTPSRSLPVTTVDAGMFFDRETTWQGERYLQTLEPRLFYLHAPYRDQSGLPLFDTRPMTFSWGQLFRDNRYSGADRQADANQLTLALTTRLIRESDGSEKLSASFGQIRYFDESRVTVPGEVPLAKGKSAWVADLGYEINDRWRISASYQWDPKFRREDLASLRTQYLVGSDGVVNFGYRHRRDLLEQVDFSFLYPLSPAWSVVGRYYYSLHDHKLLEGIAGVQWDSCCMAVRLVGRRYVRNRDGELNNTLMLEVELKGLGSAGRDARDVLRRGILGYYRDDLYLVPPPDVRSGGDDLAPAPY
ncbi:MAG TPA: LPS assembly protein LptD [Xanthomonadaceae bacterium]|nr:LPS assembly protein LptD [Xanthomonadaceae bacterium]